jgi:hypothetical protein
MHQTAARAGTLTATAARLIAELECMDRVVVFPASVVCIWWCPVAVGGILDSVFEGASVTACW